ncbi:MAG: hypothetical protein N2513_00940 [Deltaproteobacteria bacterium]|nr:hypothetical protein [Deltaproteobacteria bacterium]
MLSLDDCFRFLELFSELWPDEYVHGKFGTGDPNRPTKAVVFHLEENRDWIIVLEPKVRCCAEKLSRPYELRITRGCSFPYEALFGSCENWQIEMGVINKENLGGVIKTLEKMLYY